MEQGCPLFPTKPENTPPSLHGAIDAAETLRSYKNRGNLPPIQDLTAWEWAAFEAAEEASDTVEAEETRKMMNETKGGKDSTNEPPPEESAFGHW